MMRPQDIDALLCRGHVVETRWIYGVHVVGRENDQVSEKCRMNFA